MLMAMTSKATPTISSFVIRFVMDSSAEAGRIHPPYRGAIRHIQTDDEMNFSNWEEAVTFIRRYVPLDSENSPSST